MHLRGDQDRTRRVIALSSKLIGWNTTARVPGDLRAMRLPARDISLIVSGMLADFGLRDLSTLENAPEHLAQPGQHRVPAPVQLE
jgi:hypothetical protein